ncbi:tripartite tricarboxylate transporter TctB family protein [Fodinicurvata sp. EGI_FJ10296]|uniref:tripartite tricarboxylate transporter TctB family protein n=1 Tax=Fodinicurvata sp. EGI_FJ10296 TaxID=3231908 RepID=UPI00345195A1
MRRLNINQILAIVIAVFSAAYLYEAFQIRQFPLPRPIDSDLFPKVLGTSLLVMAVFLFFQRPRDGEFLSIEVAPDTPIHHHPWAMVAVTALAIVLYAFALRPLGFLVSSTVLVIALSVYYGYRRLVVVIPVAITIPLVLYLVLTRVMAIAMPRGILPI